MPDARDGFVRRDRNRVFLESAPFWLDRTRATGIAEGYLNFRMPVASNMQFSLISRRKIVEMASVGAFFQSPYPDFYATPALFLTSPRVLVCQEPLVVIGITPKSYGYFHFNNRASDGVAFLKNDDSLQHATAVDHIRLPGTSYNDSWLLAMQALSENHAASRGLRPNYRKYRLLQIIHSYKKVYFDGSMKSTELAGLRDRMRIVERMIVGPVLAAGFRILRAVPTAAGRRLIGGLRKLIGQHAMADDVSSGRRYENIIELFEAVARNAD
jgi:hypothetical protein